MQNNQLVLGRDVTVCEGGVRIDDCVPASHLPTLSLVCFFGKGEKSAECSNSVLGMDFLSGQGHICQKLPGKYAINNCNLCQKCPLHIKESYFTVMEGTYTHLCSYREAPAHQKCLLIDKSMYRVPACMGLQSCAHSCGM